MNAIIEAVEHDNSVPDSDQAPESEPTMTIDYDEREGLSVSDAIAWANSQRCPVTLFLYDLGSGTAGLGHSDEQAVRFPEDETRH
ncbi:hypothetical protein [Stakelama tenebrarum]|uniref:hypothetical protein n=1 Tax=Stakelama tenebrarum TaxID=2711215 RepID=UPI001D192CF6|nr:hypothetical protein [Sphingosinithalassobacter tenebrarum]